MLGEFVDKNYKAIIAFLIFFIIVIIIILGLSMGIISLKKEGVTSGYVPGGMDQGYFSGERFGNMGIREGAVGPIVVNQPGGKGQEIRGGIYDQSKSDRLDQKYQVASQDGRQLHSVLNMGGYTDLQGAINAERVAKFRNELGCTNNVAFTGDEQEWRQAQSADEVNRRMVEGMKGSLDDKLSRQMQGL